MSKSLRDALLQSGLKPSAKAKAPRPKPRRKAQAETAEMDLGKAWALRAQADARERQQQKQEAERKAREKKERRRRLQALLEGQALNRDDAERVRHYEFRGKIRRIYVSDEQLVALNRGELAVVQSGGHFLLVTAEVARQVAQIEPACLALLVDPAAAAGEDDVPDDLVW